VYLCIYACVCALLVCMYKSAYMYDATDSCVCVCVCVCVSSVYICILVISQVWCICMRARVCVCVCWTVCSSYNTPHVIYS
jgi:hypothetical protein